MIGQLSEHPLAELLHEISVHGLSGALRLEQERRKTVVYLADGEIIYAGSNLKQHRLSECVRRWHVLPEEEMTSLPVGASDFDFAAVLVKEKALSLESLAVLQSRQLIEVLRPALLWTSGTWEFDARVRLTQEVRVKVDVNSLLTESARRLPAEFVAARFSETDEKLWPEKNAPSNLELLPTEAFVLSRIDAPLTLSELSAISVLPETEMRQIVYTLTLGGLLGRERWPRAFTLEMLARARSVKAPAKETARPTTPRPTTTSVPPVNEPSPALPETVVTESVVDQKAEQEQELNAHFSRLEVASNYYQVLGVRSTATIGEIKGSYHKLAKRFHPDRFHKDVDATLHARIEEAFASIAQAYETLKDKQTRATYDLKLSLQKKPADAGSTTPPQKPGATAPAAEENAGTQANAALSRQAEESFQRGMQALKQGKPTSAIAFFAEAARLVPRESRYRAYHGRALSENEGTWRQAEAELKAALSLDSNNASYHVMLAEFYSKIGLPRRAQSELERALVIDAHNTAARQLLDKLRATKG